MRIRFKMTSEIDFWSENKLNGVIRIYSVVSVCDLKFKQVFKIHFYFTDKIWILKLRKGKKMSVLRTLKNGYITSVKLDIEYSIIIRYSAEHSVGTNAFILGKQRVKIKWNQNIEIFWIFWGKLIIIEKQKVIFIH